MVIWRASLAIWLCMICNAAGGYEPKTHEDLSAAATNASILVADVKKRATLGLPDIKDERFKYINSRGDKNTLARLIQNGASFEDDGVRSLNHFYDPRTGGPMYFDPARFLYVSYAELGALNALAQTSPNWALGTLSLPHIPQSYAYTDLKDYYLRSLTNTNNTQRAQATGLAFETLGRIIHHVQDMAQPQHVRNDPHIQDGALDTDCLGGVTLVPAWVCDTYRKLTSPSFFEKWTLRLTTAGLLPPLSGYAPVYGPGPGADGYAVFTTARLFWTNGGKGMADFTNRNFLSEGTMTEGGAPELGEPYAMRVGDLCSGMVPACGSIDPNAVIKFRPSVVDDQFRAVSLPNPFAASESIFTPDLQNYNLNDVRVFTINRATLAYDHAYLLPRAVGYSAGLINYFFRGDMEISLPNEGVYSVIDHNPAACGDPCGFIKLKLKLKNVTPGTEVMGEGDLWAVAKYHVNSCYQSDLSGEGGGSNFRGNSCRSAEEYIAVSARNAVLAGEIRPDTARQFTFDFSTKPIPIYASDVFLQVIFRGKLGEEEDAVVVATKDISEPTYYGLENATDYVFDDLGDQQYHPLAYQAGLKAIDVTDIRIAFGPNADTAITVANLDVLHAGEHARLALLMDTGPQQDSISWKGEFERPPDVVQFDPGEFTQDDTGDAAGIYQRNCDLVARRGLYMERGSIFVQQVHGIVSWQQIKSERPHATSSSLDPNSASVVHPTVARDPRCFHAPLEGMNDLSTMAPFTPEKAKPWNLRF